LSVARNVEELEGSAAEKVVKQAAA
jgi:hypothetical protein